MIACSCQRLYLAVCLLETQHSGEEAVQEAPGGVEAPDTVVNDSTRCGTPLDPLLLNLQGLLGDVMVVRGCLGHNNHKTIAFSIPGEVRKVTNKGFCQETTECGI